MQAAPKLSALETAFEELGKDGWQARQFAVERLTELSRSLDDVEVDELTERLIQEVASPRSIGSRASAQEVLTHLGRVVVPCVMQRVKARGDGARLLVDLMAFIGRQEDVSDLVSIYEDASDDQNLRAAIASVLGSIGGPEACQALCRMLEDPEPHLRVFALDGLRMARFPVPASQLLELTKDILTRKAAVSMMAYSQDPQSILPLLDFLCDRVRGVRSAALVSIGGLLSWARQSESHTALTTLHEALACLSFQAKQGLVALAKDGDREVLCTALDVGALCIHVPLLGVAVDHMDDGAVYERSISLAAICGESTLGFFETWLDDPVKAVVLEPIYRLVAMSGVDELSETWRQHLLLQVQGGQLELAGAACEALGRCGGKELISSLYLYCKEDGPIGEHAADALAQLLLRHQLKLSCIFDEQEGHDGIQQAVEAAGPLARNICRVIGKVGDADAENFLGQVLGCPDVEARIAAIVALGRVQVQSKTESLLRLALADENPQARAAACRSLARLGLCRAEAGLLVATEDVSAFVRAAAVQSLVKLNCRSARPRLIEMIEQRDSPAVIAYAIEGLGRWGNPKDEARLIALARDSELEIAKASIRGLEHYSSTQASKAICALLEHERWDVRWVCAESLKERKDPSTITAIRETLRREQDPLVYETLSGALSACGALGVNE